MNNTNENIRGVKEMKEKELIKVLSERLSQEQQIEVSSKKAMIKILEDSTQGKTIEIANYTFK